MNLDLESIRTTVKSEHLEQVAFFEWCKLVETQHPELKLAFAVPNAGKRGRRRDKYGRWYSIEGKRLKEEGMKRGVPDILLPVKSRDGRYIGLAIEMKTPSGQLTPEQLEWIAMLTDAGWLTAVCYNWREAALAVAGYLGFEFEG